MLGNSSSCKSFQISSGIGAELDVRMAQNHLRRDVLVEQHLFHLLNVVVWVTRLWRVCFVSNFARPSTRRFEAPLRAHLLELVPDISSTSLSNGFATVRLTVIVRCPHNAGRDN